MTPKTHAQVSTRNDDIDYLVHQKPKQSSAGNANIDYNDIQKHMPKNLCEEMLSIMIFCRLIWLKYTRQVRILATTV